MKNGETCYQYGIQWQKKVLWHVVVNQNQKQNYSSSVGSCSCCAKKNCLKNIPYHQRTIYWSVSWVSSSKPIVRPPKKSEYLASVLVPKKKLSPSPNCLLLRHHRFLPRRRQPVKNNCKSRKRLQVQPTPWIFYRLSQVLLQLAVKIPNTAVVLI